jgi:hypothetical protein
LTYSLHHSHSLTLVNAVDKKNEVSINVTDLRRIILHCTYAGGGVFLCRSVLFLLPPESNEN